jgi:hypothetical protein
MSQMQTPDANLPPPASKISGVRKGAPTTKANVTKNPENHKANPKSSVVQGLNPGSDAIIDKNAVAAAGGAKLTMADLMHNPKACASTYNHPVPKHQKNIGKFAHTQKPKNIQQPRACN